MVVRNDAKDLREWLKNNKKKKNVPNNSYLILFQLGIIKIACCLNSYQNWIVKIFVFESSIVEIEALILIETGNNRS